MKSSDSYARSLRPRKPGRWLWRFAALLALLIGIVGLLMGLTGAATLLGHPLALGEFTDTPSEAGVLLGGGLILLLLAILLWRKCRRSLQASSDLSIAPHLLKKRG
jgi:hypothetical protein